MVWEERDREKGVIRSMLMAGKEAERRESFVLGAFTPLAGL